MTTYHAAFISETSIIILRTDRPGVLGTHTIAYEPRPASLKDADIMLAAHSFGRTGDWDLVGAGLGAPLKAVDNVFNGTVAARLDQAVGITHGEFELALASTVENGDLVTDAEYSAVYVVAGSEPHGESAKLHMVGEGQTWDDRHTSEFTLIRVARRKS
jgi:hypothetical protein